MKLERLHEHVMTALVLFVGMGLAIYCGKIVGAGNNSGVAMLLFGLLFGFCALYARDHIWVAIPIFWGWNGRLIILPVPAAAREVLIISIFSMFLMYKALKLIRLKPKNDLLTVALLVNVLYLATVFLRNPVGTVAGNSDRIGGRSYFSVGVALLGFWVLRQVRCNFKQARILPFAVVLSSLTQAVVSMLCERFWFLANVLGNIYENFAVDTRLTSADLTGEHGDDIGRNTELEPPTLNAIDMLSAYFRPLTMVNPLYFWRCLALLIALAGILWSGYRSLLIYCVMSFAISSYVRRGSMELVRIGIVVAPVFALVIVAQGTFFQLPLTAQRALSFLPGNWAIEAVRDADTSTKWRTEMWRLALTTDRYIHNKIFGDGFGFTKMQFQQIQVLNAMASSSIEETQESALLVGNYHSGPVTAIRTVGYFGLLLYYGLAFQVARTGYRLIHRAAKTPFLTFALYLGIPAMIHPFYFTLIFGTYAYDLPDTIIRAGMLKMLQNSLEAHELLTIDTRAVRAVQTVVAQPRRPHAPLAV